MSLVEQRRRRIFVDKINYNSLYICFYRVIIIPA